MSRRASYATTVLGMSLALVAGSPFWGSVRPITASGSQSAPETPLSVSLDLIRRQKYDEAITRLEQILETDSANGEALTLLGTANLYRDLDFTKAQKEFMAAYKAGGGATFFVTHSHEGFAGEDVVNYCRGWLHLRKSGVEFAAIDSPHSFKISFAELEEFKQNRFSKLFFHIKVNRKNQNFRGRSASELEPLLILALYKSFARS